MVCSVSNQVNLKVLIEADLKSRLDDLLDRKRISLTAGVDAFVRWLLEQDSLVQSVVLGQIEPKDRSEIAGLILKRLTGTPAKASLTQPLKRPMKGLVTTADIDAFEADTAARIAERKAAERRKKREGPEEPRNGTSG